MPLTSNLVKLYRKSRIDSFRPDRQFRAEGPCDKEQRTYTYYMVRKPATGIRAAGRTHLRHKGYESNGCWSEEIVSTIMGRGSCSTSPYGQRKGKYLEEVENSGGVVRPVVLAFGFFLFTYRSLRFVPPSPSSRIRSAHMKESCLSAILM